MYNVAGVPSVKAIPWKKVLSISSSWFSSTAFITSSEENHPPSSWSTSTFIHNHTEFMNLQRSSAQSGLIPSIDS